jgi:hypothetical protein
VPPIEATIALSILFLASEIACKRRDTLTWRYPVAVSASFGLLHGFGFASALREIGLPVNEIPTALFFFNVGVEIGQIVFVLVLLALIVLLMVVGILKRTVSSRNGVMPATMALPTAYIIGTISAYWTIERAAGLWI